MKKESRNLDVFEKLPVPQAVMNMALPTIMGQLIILFYNMADTFFVGQTDNPFMVAGASLILPVYNVALALSCLAGVGGGALVSRLLGQNRREEAGRVSSFSIYMAVGLAGLFSVCMALFMNPILELIGASRETFRYAREYAFCVIVCGAIPTVLSTTLANLLRSVGESKKAGLGVTLGGLINVALDPLFMFVLLPQGYEIMGAGIATALSNCISCGYFILVLRGLGEDSVLKLRPMKERPTGESIKDIFNVGIPSAVAGFLFDLDYMVIGRLMSAYGEIEMAAIGIVLKVERLPLNIGIGICQGMVPIVAYNYSAKNFDRMKKTVRVSRNAGMICGVLSILLYELFAPVIMGAFIGDPSTVAIGTNFLRVRVLATPLMFLSFFHVHLFNGFGEGRKALFLGMVRWLVFNIPMLFLLNAIFGMYGIVWSQITADIFTVALSVYVYQKFEKKLQQGR